MPIIKIDTPTQGVVQFEIEGENPNEEELQVIQQNFFTEQAGDRGKLDLATASVDEIKKFTEASRKSGVDPITGEEMTPEDPLKDEDVDYTSGLQLFSIRAGLGQRENDEERALFLTDKVGADGFRQDKGGRFILTKEGRKKLGLVEGPELAIDEEGFSRYDLADFVGEGGVSLGVGIAASIALGGVGALYALPAVGVAMGLGKLADEAYETAQGYQTQSPEEQQKDAVFEGVFGLLGEGAGRVISRFLGGFIKGSASRQAEEAKELGRELISKQKGFRPTVEGGAPGAFGILGRLQAVYEGVIPNKKAAELNVNAILRELRSFGGADEQAVDRLSDVIKKDLEKVYQSSEEAFQEAQKVMSKEVEVEIARIMEPLKKGEELGTDALAGLQAAKTVFNEQVDNLYKTAENALGKENQIVPIGALKKSLEEMKLTNPNLASLFDSNIGKILKKAENDAIARLQRRAGTVPEYQGEGPGMNAMPREQFDAEVVAREMYLTPQMASVIRKNLSDLEDSPRFQQSLATGNKFRDLMDEAFLEAEDNLNMAVSRIEYGVSDYTGYGIDRILDDVGSNAIDLKNLKEGFTLLRRTNRFYARGNQRFSDPVVTNLYRLTRNGKLQTDPTVILDKVVKANQPKLLERLLQSRRGVATVLDEVDAPRVRFGGKEFSIEEAKSLLNQADATRLGRDLGRTGDAPLPDKRRLEEAIQFAESQAKVIADERAVAGVGGEELRQQLATSWMTRLLSDKSKSMTIKDGVEVFDGMKIANAIKGLGTTKNTLFRGEIKEIDDLVSLLSGTGATFDRALFRRLGNTPIAQASKAMREEVAKNRALNSQNYIKSLKDADANRIVDTIFQRENPERVRQFMNNSIKVGGEPVKFSNEAHRVLKEDFKDAAMGRILRSVGDVDSPLFQKDFLSGRLGGKLQTTLNNYGRETLNATFGKDRTNDLFKLSEIMVRASDQPLAGKGGLAAPNIALGLSLFGIITNPLATLPTLLFFTGMSKALRTKPVLDILLASRKPGEDAIGQALQTMHTIAAQVQFQGLESREGPLSTSPEIQQKIQQGLSGIRSAIPNVAPAFGGTSTANVDPTNPIVNPDPATQALAQALSQRPPS
jgi:hypothetical protein